MKDRNTMKRHERRYGPHFNEECAEWCVSKMENEDGTKGAHWTIEETTSVAEQYGVNLKGDKYNKYDWFVALNMVYSDFYKVAINLFGNSSIQFFTEIAKAWINDKDVPEGKTWNYFSYVVCDDKEDEEDEEDEYDYYDEDDDEDDEDEYPIYVKQYSRSKHHDKHHIKDKYLREGEYEYYEPMYRKRKRFSKY